MSAWGMELISRGQKQVVPWKKPKKSETPLRFIYLIRTIFSLLSKPKQLFGAEFSNDDGDVLCHSNIA